MRDVNIRSEALSYRTYRKNTCKNLVRKIVSRHSKMIATNKKDLIKLNSSTQKQNEGDLGKWEESLTRYPPGRS